MYTIHQKAKELELKDYAIGSSRSNIVLVLGAESRPPGRTDTSFVNNIGAKYSKEGMTFPYHYIVTSEGNVINTKPTSIKGGEGFLQGYENDIIIFSEVDFRYVDYNDHLSMTSIVNLVIENTLINRMPLNSTFVVTPKTIVNENTLAVTKLISEIDERVQETLEDMDLEYIYLYSLNDDEGVTGITPSENYTHTEMADIIGCSREVIEELNSISSAGKMNLQMFSVGYMNALIGPTTMKVLAQSTVNSTNKEMNRVQKYIMNTGNFIGVPYGNAPIPFISPVVANSIKLSTPTPKVPTVMPSQEDGKRPFDMNTLYRLELPGYENAHFEFTNIKTGETQVIGFMISPNGFNFTSQNNRPLHATSGGYFSMRMNKPPDNLSITGVLVDSSEAQERHNFIDEYYKRYVIDRRNANNEIFNDWETAIVIEGRRYIGNIESFSFSKSSNRKFLYDYSISFSSFKDVLVYKNANAKARKYPKQTSPSFVPGAKTFVGPTLASMMKV